jgi:hypothetical protein
MLLKQKIMIETGLPGRVQSMQRAADTAGIKVVAFTSSEG